MAETKINKTHIGNIKGKDGTTPHIGDNGNWFIGNTDTKVTAGLPNELTWKEHKGDYLMEGRTYRVTLQKSDMFTISFYDGEDLEGTVDDYNHVDNFYFTDDGTASGKWMDGIITFSVKVTNPLEKNQGSGNKEFYVGDYFSYCVTINGVEHHRTSHIAVGGYSYIAPDFKLGTKKTGITYTNVPCLPYTKYADQAGFATQAGRVIGNNQIEDGTAYLREHGFYGISGGIEITFSDGTELVAYSFMVYIPKGWDGSRFIVPFPVSVPFDGGYNIVDFVAIIENFTFSGILMKDYEEYGSPTMKSRLDNCNCMRFDV